MKLCPTQTKPRTPTPSQTGEARVMLQEQNEQAGENRAGGKAQVPPPNESLPRDGRMTETEKSHSTTGGLPETHGSNESEKLTLITKSSTSCNNSVLIHSDHPREAARQLFNPVIFQLEHPSSST